MKDNMYKTSVKNKFNCVDSDENQLISIKKKIMWFPFLRIMEHTENKMKENNGLISSLLNIFAMFQIRLICGDKELEVLSLKCINCKRETGFDSNTNFTWVYDEIVTKFVLNSMLHNVGMSWIISSNLEMEYEMNKTNHQDWLNKETWYNTSICLKLHGSRFEGFIAQARTDRYNIICYLVSHDILQLYYKNDESIIGDRAISDDATIKTLE